MPDIPRGIRNNNPGNIRLGQPWQGLARFQSDSSFCQFISPEYGIRALSKILRTYYSKYGLTSINSIISKYAPPEENNTDSYIDCVSKACGVGKDDKIQLSTVLLNIIKGIIQHENGQQPYSDEQINKSISMQ